MSLSEQIVWHIEQHERQWGKAADYLTVELNLSTLREWWEQARVTERRRRAMERLGEATVLAVVLDRERWKALNRGDESGAERLATVIGNAERREDRRLDAALEVREEQP